MSITPINIIVNYYIQLNNFIITNNRLQVKTNHKINYILYCVPRLVIPMQ